MNTKSWAIALSLTAISLFALPALPVRADAAGRKAEMNMGREASIEVEKENKVITDPTLTEPLERIGKALADVANTESVAASYGSSEVYKFQYKFKLLDDDSVNAFSLPGGYIYVNKGLLKYVESDHELAGILAHEIAHASHHHMTYLFKEQSRMDGKIGLALIASMLTGVKGTDMNQLLIGAQLVRIAGSSGYGQKAEADADTAGVEYCAKAGFNPVGSLTFLERLSHDYSMRPSVDMGIMQTHPATTDRCKAVLARIKSLGLPVNRRAVTKSLCAEVTDAQVGDKRVSKVSLGDKTLFEAADTDSDGSAHDRAVAIASKVNRLLDSEPTVREIKIGPDGSTVLARGEPVVTVTSQDCIVTGKPAADVAAEAAHVLKLAVWGDMVQRM